MKWIVNMKIKDYIRNWSDQEIKTEYKGVRADIKIKDTNCELILEGDENIKTVFQLIWELLFLYDGYFMSQYHTKLMGIKKIVKSLLYYHFIKQIKNGIIQNY